ncbi:polysaccharide biosynthesis/export family protein [Sphingopyxis sp. MG]|uniref:polysaccharide biosynthesis/export family protein n=1 Tax=Sphingopyxis sp. MG TaxID=1866325 RepID=UPI000CDF5479|nr:polysaccharide biosynthesis/export family protein [Sphingopyxis sp. MG]AVA13615.1 polysaccharide export protein [Sphingopyxis sp. MG]
MTVPSRILPLALVAIALAGCGGAPAPVASVPNAPVTKIDELPVPVAADVVNSTRTALIGPFSELRVEVFNVPEMQQDILTDGKGNFAFPLIGTVEAAGKAPSEVAEEIRGRLVGRFVRDPKVTVNFKSSLNPLVQQAMSAFVDGEVKRSGSYPIVGHVTLMRAVAMAGGADEFAKLQDVVIFREVEGKRYVGLYNLEAIRRGNYGDPEVYPGDIIIVGDSVARRRIKDVMQVVPTLLAPLFYQL